MTSHDTEELGNLATIYKALGNETRLKLIFQIESGDPISELTDDISRSGLQKHVESLIDAEIVYRPVDSSKTYELTSLGKTLLEKIEQENLAFGHILLQFNSTYHELREKEQETLDRMEDAGVDTKELEDKLTAKAWEMIEDVVERSEEDEEADAVEIMDPSDEDVGGLGGGMKR